MSEYSHRGIFRRFERIILSGLTNALGYVVISDQVFLFDDFYGFFYVNLVAKKKRTPFCSKLKPDAEEEKILPFPRRGTATPSRVLDPSAGKAWNKDISAQAPVRYLRRNPNGRVHLKKIPTS